MAWTVRAGGWVLCCATQMSDDRVQQREGVIVVRGRNGSESASCAFFRWPQGSLARRVFSFLPPSARAFATEVPVPVPVQLDLTYSRGWAKALITLNCTLRGCGKSPLTRARAPNLRCLGDGQGLATIVTRFGELYETRRKYAYHMTASFRGKLSYSSGSATRRIPRRVRLEPVHGVPVSHTPPTRRTKSIRRLSRACSPAIKPLSTLSAAPRDRHFTVRRALRGRREILSLHLGLDDG